MVQGASQSETASADGRAADDVVAALEARIYSGDLAMGHPLPPERELVQAFGISRTVAREAVKILAGKGLVETRPRFRPVVAQPSADRAFGVMDSVVRHLLNRPGGIKDLYDTRIFVERGLVRQAALDANRDDIANLRSALADNQAAIDQSERFYATDAAFHAVLYGIPRNDIFPAVHRSFSTWLSDHWTKMPSLPERNFRNFQAHTAIFEAILNRDPDLAERHLLAHLNDAWAQVSETFGAI